MISCYDLRIGNNILVDSKLLEVSMINSTGISVRGDEDKESPVFYNLDRLQPVPLTDTVLKECGFSYHYYFKFWQIINTDKGGRSEMDLSPDYEVIDFMRKPILKKLKYLHELQNTYYLLKGKELRLAPVVREPFQSNLAL